MTLRSLRARKERNLISKKKKTIKSKELGPGEKGSPQASARARWFEGGDRLIKNPYMDSPTVVEQHASAEFVCNQTVALVQILLNNSQVHDNMKFPSYLACWLRPQLKHCISPERIVTDEEHFARKTVPTGSKSRQIREDEEFTRQLAKDDSQRHISAKDRWTKALTIVSRSKRERSQEGE